MGGENQTCEIRRWRVFGPGVFKDTAEYFSPSDCAKIAANFRRFAHLTVPLKLGHDRSQRYRDSLGLPAGGRVVGLSCSPAGVLTAARVVGIPRIIGSAIVSGFLPGGSIELAPRGEPGRRIVRDPKNPAAPIDGDVMIGLALLGEELPANQEVGPPPRPVFADGSPVPPLTDAEVRWWLERMAPYLAPAGKPGGQDDGTAEFAGWSVAFSAMTFDPVREVPVDPQALIAALQALPPDQLQQVLAAVQPAGQDPNNMSGSDALRGANQDAQLRAINAKEPKNESGAEHYAAMGGADDPVAKSPVFKAFVADMKKCMGALQEKASADQKAAEEREMAALATRVDAVYAAGDNRKRLTPVEWAAKRQLGLDILTSKSFAAAADRETAFSAWAGSIAALPVNPLLTDAAADAKPEGRAAAGQTVHGRKVVAALESVAPNVHKRLTAVN